MTWAGLFRRRGSYLQPSDIGVVRRRDVEGQVVVVLDGGHGARVSPLVDFGMAVGKGDATGVGVEAGGVINDLGFGIGEATFDGKAGVIDAVGVFVGNDPEHIGRWSDDVRQFT